MNQPLRILIADDHPLFRRGLMEVLEEDSSITVVHQSEDGNEAFRKIEELKPDIAILDFEMPGLSGLEVVKKVREVKLQTRVIILTMYKSEEMVDEALNVGVNGYVLKANAVLDILQCIKLVARGELYLSSELSKYLLKRREKEDNLAKQMPSIKNLSVTECKILRLIANNKTSKEIADEFCVSQRTVENHRMNICNKLNLHGAHTLLRFAIANRDAI